MFFNFLNVYPENKAINGAYLVGHLSVFFLISNDRSKIISIINLISISLLGGRRFLIMLIPHFIKKISVFKFSFLLIILYSLLYYFTIENYFSGNIDNYSIGLGYRVFEINLMLENLNTFDFLFGSGLGSKSFFMNLCPRERLYIMVFFIISFSL